LPHCTATAPARCGSQCGRSFHQSLSDWFGELDRVRAIFGTACCRRNAARTTRIANSGFRNGVTATLDASLANAVDTSYERVRFNRCGRRNHQRFEKSDIVGASSQSTVKNFLQAGDNR